MSTTADRPLPESDKTPPLPAGPLPTPVSSGGPRNAAGLALTTLIRRVHFYAGLLVAPFLVILCLTGIAYVFTPQLDDVLYARELTVAPQPGPARPLDDQVGAALAAYPAALLTSVTPAAQPDRTTAVLVDPPDSAGDDHLAVYVNPYTAEVTGTLTLVHGEPPVQRLAAGLPR